MVSGRLDVRPEQEIFDDLHKLCSSSGYMHAVAHFCFRDNTLKFNEKISAEDMAELHSYSRLIRTEISTLIGLALCSPVNWTHPGADCIQKLIDKTEKLLEELHVSLSSAFFENITPEKITSDDFNPLIQGAALREPIFYGAESAYTFQYKDLATKRYKDDEAWIIAHKGFSLDDASRSIASILEVLNQKQMVTLQEIREVAPSDWTMLPAFSFTSREVADRSGVDEGTVNKVIAAFAFSSESRNSTFSSLNDYNAANAVPIISLGEGRYVLFQYYSLVESFYESPLFWFSEDKKYIDTALTHRGVFTEVASKEFLERVFGTDNVHVNVNIFKGKKTKIGEIDVLIVYGDRYVVLQAKSKRLTIESRRGNDLQIKDDFKKAVQDAYDQAIVCSEAIKEQGLRFVSNSGGELEFKYPPKIIFPVCIVSDHYPALNFQARQFLELQASERIVAPIVTDLFALDAMTEMLRSPLRFLSYLSLRAQHSDRVHAMNELSLLGYHLKQNLWLLDVDGFVTIGDDFSTELDIAMLVRREGLPGAATPEGILTRLVNSSAGKLIAQLEESPEPAILDIGMLLLEANEDSLIQLSAGLDRIRKETQVDRGNHDVSIGLGGAGLTVHCNYLSNSEAAKRLEAHCEARKYAEKADVWHGLAIFPDDGSIRFGCEFTFHWMHNEKMEAAIKSLGIKRRGEPSRPVAKRKVGRNDPCPCGSNLKYKKCCLPNST